MNAGVCESVCGLARAHGPPYACGDGCVHDGVHVCAHVDVLHCVYVHVTVHEGAYVRAYDHSYVCVNVDDGGACDDDHLV